MHATAKAKPSPAHRPVLPSMHQPQPVMLLLGGQATLVLRWRWLQKIVNQQTQFLIDPLAQVLTYQTFNVKY